MDTKSEGQILNTTSAKGLFSGPLWLVGFRPFFVLALISGAVFPILWALVFNGHLQLPDTGLSVLQWHAHEMLFGFGWAVIGGFLLTASKNWVHIRGLHGAPLAFAAALWMIERFEMLFMPWTDMHPVVRFIAYNIFLLYVVGYLVWSLVVHRKSDTFADNYFFIIALPLFLVAKNLMFYSDTFMEGYLLAIGLFRVAFAVMFERTVTQFMKNALQTEILRNPALDMAIKFFVLISAFSGFCPDWIAAPLLFLAGSLLLFRFLFWHPFVAFRKFEIGVMYVGYLGLVIHFYLEGLRRSGGLSNTLGTLSLHAFTFLCMGVIIPAMLIRISQGHTGRKLLFTFSDRMAFAFMGLAAFFRLVATQIWPQAYVFWIALAAVGWSLCFSIIGVRIMPFLWRERVDGREH